MTVPPHSVLNASLLGGSFGSSVQSGIPYQYNAQRYHTVSGTGAFAFRGGAVAGFLFDVATPSVSGGVRLQRASIDVEGEKRFFNFGFGPTQALSDGDVISVDLTGGGEQSYRAALGLGPSNPAMYYGTAAGVGAYDQCSPILPWNEA